MLDDPLGEARRDPEAVDTESDDAEQELFDPVAEQGCPRSGEADAVTSDQGVLRPPAIPHADGPRSTEAQCDDSQEECADTDSEVSLRAAIKLELATLVRSVSVKPRWRYSGDQTVSPRVVRRVGKFCQREFAIHAASGEPRARMTPHESGPV